MKKDSGVFLTLLMVWGIIGAIEVLYQVTNTNVISQTLKSFPNWFFLYTIIANVVFILAIIGSWMMKKWGVYLLALSFLVRIAVLLFLKQTTILQFILALILISLWSWAIARKWKSFT